MLPFIIDFRLREDGPHNMFHDKVKKMTRALSLSTHYGQDGAFDVKQLHRARKRVLRVVVACGIVVLLFHRSPWATDSLIYQTLTRTGVLLLAIAIAGRTWIWVHLGRRRHRQFVSDGPYSVVRHPLYACSILGTAGIGAQTGSLAMMFLLSAAVWAVFNRVAQIEEMDMASRFGEPYRGYLLGTPRFVPDLRLWTAPHNVPVEYQHLINCLRDASGFVLAVPTFIAIDWAQQTGFLPVLFGLP